MIDMIEAHKEVKGKKRPSCEMKVLSRFLNRTRDITDKSNNSVWK